MVAMTTRATEGAARRPERPATHDAPARCRLPPQPPHRGLYGERGGEERKEAPPLSFSPYPTRRGAAPEWSILLPAAPSRAVLLPPGQQFTAVWERRPGRCLW